MAAEAAAAWLVRFPRRSRGRLTLVCFPHAGGGAAVFHGLSRLLPESIETVAVVPPGREARLREPPIESLAAMAEDAAAAIAARITGPTAFFGHSMGAILAFEVARRFQREGRRAALPLRLFLSGRRAVNQPAPAEEAPLSVLDDEAFVLEMALRYGGIPDAVRADAELLRLFVPTLRADIRAIEGYRFNPEAAPPLPVPFTLMGGEADPQCSDTAWTDWEALTAHPVEMVRFPGGHFYLMEDRAAVAHAIAACLPG
jgi:medium-chain acyl-[acyl-carrier-protein] hydrolase